MTYIPRHEVTKHVANKFEAIKIAALEARRLNAQAHMLGIVLPRKITTLAIERLLDGKVVHYDKKERAAKLKEERAKEQEEA